MSVEKKQKIMIIIFIIVTIITICVIAFGFYGDKIKRIFKIKSSLKTQVVQPPEINIDFELLESETLKELYPFLTFPEFEGQAGRSNPFIPPSGFNLNNNENQ